MIKISVVVPIYNVDKYLGECLDSVLNQKMKDIEIILINDGSTDTSLKICKEYSKKDSRIKLVSQINKGVSAARNLGLEIAKGKYISFIDPDDWIHCEMYEALYKNMENNNLDLCTCGFTKVYGLKYETTNFYNAIIDKNDIINKFYVGLIANKDFNKKNELRSQASVGNKLYKKSYLYDYNIRFDEELVLGEDLVFNLNYLLHCNKIEIINKNYYYYRVYTNSTINKYRDKFWQESKNMLMKIEILFNYNKKLLKDIEILHLRIIQTANLAIANECKNNEKKIYSKINKIRDILNDRLVIEASKKLNTNILTTERKIGLYLIKYKLGVIIYIL